MPFEIHPARKEDASAIAEVALCAFSGPFNRRLFPLTANVRGWWIKKFTKDCVEPKPNDILLKAVDTSAKTEAGEDVIVAFAIWNLPPPDPTAVNQCREENAPQWPEESDKELCDRFFSRMEEGRVRFVGGRRHYYLDTLATHPAYSGRGLGTQLLKWGLTKADHDGLEAFLAATPHGRPLYEKHGFKLVDSEEICPGHDQSYMLRPGKGSE